MNEKGPERSRTHARPVAILSREMRDKALFAKAPGPFLAAACPFLRDADRQPRRLAAGSRTGRRQIRPDAAEPRSTEPSPEKRSRSWMSASRRHASGSVANSWAMTRSSSGGAGASLRPKRMRNGERPFSISSSVNSPGAGRAPARHGLAADQPQRKKQGRCRWNLRSVARLRDQRPSPLHCLPLPVAADGIDHHAAAVGTETFEPVGEPFERPAPAARSNGPGQIAPAGRAPKGRDA